VNCLPRNVLIYIEQGDQNITRKVVIVTLSIFSTRQLTVEYMQNNHVFLNLSRSLLETVKHFISMK
jgi:hypothetical protein